jgi:hypothetical protein
VGVKKKVIDLFTHAWAPGPNVDGWCTKTMLQNCEFFSLSKLLYIIFLANIEDSVLG